MRALLLSLAVAGALLAPRAAFADGVPLTKQAVLLLRTLAYDRQLHTRAKEEVRVLVVYARDDAQGRADAQELVRALSEVAKNSVVGGLRISVQATAESDSATFKMDVTRVNPTAIYFTTGLQEVVTELATISHAAHALSACGSRAMVEHGVAVGFVPREGRAGVLIQLAQAKAAGTDLDPALLSLAELIKP